MASVMTKNTGVKIKNKQKHRVVFRSYIQMKDGEVEFIEPERAIRPKCGEIWKCDLGENNGSVQSGYRPVFVISNNKNNTFSNTVNVFPLTSKMKRQLPVHVELTNYEEYGLTAPSTILVEQPMTITIDQMVKRIGEVKDSKILYSICEAMEIQFPIMSMNVQSIV